MATGELGATLLYVEWDGRAVNSNHLPKVSTDQPVLWPTVGGIESDSTTTVSNKPAVNPQALTGEVHEATGTIDWYDRFHIKKRRYDLGNILTQQTDDIEVYSAHRKDDQGWTAFTNNAGTGVSVSGLPTFTKTMKPMESVDLTLTVEVFGDPTVDSTLDFFFDAQTLEIPITFDRIVVVLPGGGDQVLPEGPYTELLEFKTDILRKKNGKEMRRSLRKNPRQFFNQSFILDDGQMRSSFQNAFFEWHRNDFGVPIWHDQTFTTAAATAGNVTLSVESTDYADFRVGGLVLVITNGLIFDVLALASFTSTSITLQSGIANNYDPGTLVVPVHIGYIDGQITGSRWPNSTARNEFNVRMKDNDISIADTSAFSSYNSKVLIDGCNTTRGQKPESFAMPVTRLDSNVGRIYEVARTPTNARTHELIVMCHNRQTSWETRQLFHALRGQQISFYISSFSKDVEVVTDLVNSGNTVEISYVGYDRFVQEQLGRNVLRFVFNNGLSPIVRGISSSSQPETNKEILTLDGTWPQNIPIDEIESVSFVEKVRCASDTITIIHHIDARRTEFVVPVEAVFE